MVPLLCRSISGAGRSWRPPSLRARLPRTLSCCTFGHLVFSCQPQKVPFTALLRRLAGDQIAAPLKANSRLSEGVNISQCVTSVLFIMNIFSLLSGDLPTLWSHKASPWTKGGCTSPHPHPTASLTPYFRGGPVKFLPAPGPFQERRVFFRSLGSPPALLKARDT